MDEENQSGVSSPGDGFEEHDKSDNSVDRNDHSPDSMVSNSDILNDAEQDFNMHTASTNVYPNVSKVIAARAVERMEDVKKREELLIGAESMWKDDETEKITYFLCCTSDAQHPHIPGRLKKSNRGNFGFFKKDGGRRMNLKGLLESHTTNQQI